MNYVKSRSKSGLSKTSFEGSKQLPDLLECIKSFSHTWKLGRDVGILNYIRHFKRGFSVNLWADSSLIFYSCLMFFVTVVKTPFLTYFPQLEGMR